MEKKNSYRRLRVLVVSMTSVALLVSLLCRRRSAAGRAELSLVAVALLPPYCCLSNMDEGTWHLTECEPRGPFGNQPQQCRSENKRNLNVSLPTACNGRMLSESLWESSA